MFTINIKGRQNPKDLQSVKLEMVFFQTNYARVSKVLNITGQSLYYTPLVIKHRAERPTLRTALNGRQTTIAPKQHPHRNDKTSRRAKANG